jgi:hypothetical protein
MRNILFVLGLVFFASAGPAGCESPTPASRHTVKSFLPDNAVPTNLTGFSHEEVTRASKLYTAKCARCHKFYDPAAYNDSEWRTWMTKMNKKAHLKPEQAELLSRYLEGFRKSSSGEDAAGRAKP